MPGQGSRFQCAPPCSAIPHRANSQAASLPCLPRFLPYPLRRSFSQSPPRRQLSQPAAIVNTVPAHKPLHPRSHPAKPVPNAGSPNPAPAPPPEPPNLQTGPSTIDPAEATVVWNSQGLRIDASNSSLQQILKDVSTATGVKVMDWQRTSASSAPTAPPRRAKSSRNSSTAPATTSLIIGDQGQGTPRQIVLTLRPRATHPRPPTPRPLQRRKRRCRRTAEQPQPQGPPALATASLPARRPAPRSKSCRKCSSANATADRAKQPAVRRGLGIRSR